MPLIARTEEVELDGDDLLVTTFLNGRLSSTGVKRTAMVRARAEAGIPVPPMFTSGMQSGIFNLMFERTEIEEHDIERRGPFVRGTVTARVKNVK